MKTYYAVTQGEYSDYRIITITEDKEKAERIAAAYDGDVEEYEDSIINPDYFEDTLFNEGMTWTIYVTAENKEVAQKIAYDKYAQWKAEREGLT